MRDTKKALPSSAASGFSSLNCGLERTKDWVAAAPVSIFRALPRQPLADGPQVLLQACVFPFVDLFLTCLGCEAWPLSRLLWDTDLEHDESTSDVYNRADIEEVRVSSKLTVPAERIVGWKYRSYIYSKI